MLKFIKNATLVVACLVSAGSALAESRYRPSQPPAKDVYVNESSENIYVYSRGVYPGAQRQYIKTLRSNESHSITRGLVGSTTIFHFASDDAPAYAEERSKTIWSGVVNYTALLRKPHYDPAPAPPAPEATRYINRTGKHVRVYNTTNGNPMYRSTPRYVKTLGLYDTHEVTVYPGSPHVSFKLTDGRDVETKQVGENEYELHLVSRSTWPPTPDTYQPEQPTNPWAGSPKLPKPVNPWGPSFPFRW